MKKLIFLSMVLILGFSTSSPAQAKVIPQGKSSKEIEDSQKISQSLRVKPYTFDTISADGTQIIVIDGKVSENGFEGIGSNDIQSISVLKGEKAALLYGDKNASSVIIITTKKVESVANVEKQN